MEDEVRVSINSDADLVTARAEDEPWPNGSASPTGSHPNRHRYFGGRTQHRRARRHGEIVLRPFQEADRYGLVVIASDDGPGIPTSRLRSVTTTAAGAASAWVCREHAA